MRNYVDDLKSIPITDVANRLGLRLTKTGNSLQGNCPTGHPSKNGKCFSINTDHNYFNCFNCGEAGDVISLVELVNKYEFKEAASWLAMEYGVSIPETVSDTRKRDDKFYTQAAMYEEIFQYGRYLLFQPDGGETRQYLTKYRGYPNDYCHRSKSLPISPEWHFTNFRMSTKDSNAWMEKKTGCTTRV